ANTGLTAQDVFYWGNAIGNSGNGDTTSTAPTNTTDELSARNNPRGVGNFATITDPNDFDRDRNVNSTDQLIARNNGTGIGTQLVYIKVGANGPFAPEAAPLALPAGAVSDVDLGDHGIASALTSSPNTHLADVPSQVWLFLRDETLDVLAS